MSMQERNAAWFTDVSSSVGLPTNWLDRMALANSGSSYSLGSALNAISWHKGAGWGVTGVNPE